MSGSDIETKLAAARTRLILDKPFLGALVLRLPLTPASAKWCRTTGTDARKFYYNPDYIDALSLDQVEFVMAHEALHCALSHFVRREHRNKHRWDLACDHAINPLLLADGLTPPPGVFVDKSFEGMTAEEIYPMIEESTADEPMDQHLYDDQTDSGSGQNQGKADQNPLESRDDGEQGEDEGDEGGSDGQEPDHTGEGEARAPNHGDNQTDDLAPPPLTPSEKATLAVQWQQRMAGAAQQAMQAGKLGGALARLIDHLLQPQLPWRMLLARYMSAIARDDYTYMRPSRRDGNAILPSLRSSQINIVIGLDTSGSIGDSELREFLSEVDAIKGQLRARITLLACDAKLNEHGPLVFEPWEELDMPDKFTGGGGTSFDPVFDWVHAQDSDPDLLVYFTDGEATFPKTEPFFPVIWLIKGRNKVPWGQRIQLN